MTSDMRSEVLTDYQRRSEVKERPILFSAPMVRALLAGTKTQTRRMFREQPSESLFDIVTGEAISCPYGVVGDRLWVRESTRFASALDRFSPVAIGTKSLDAGYSKPWAPLRYEADGATRNADVLKDFGGAWGKLRPGIHLPRWASRITLEITGVRVQRLHDITEDDARAEGVKRDAAPCDHQRHSCDDVGCMGPTYRSTFAELWMQINGDDSWRSNPWVWVVSFKRIEEKRRG